MVSVAQTDRQTDLEAAAAAVGGAEASQPERHVAANKPLVMMPWNNRLYLWCSWTSLPRHDMENDSAQGYNLAWESAVM